MNIQEGQYYIARNGELVGTMVCRAYGDLWITQSGRLYAPEDITDTVDNAARKHVEGN